MDQTIDSHIAEMNSLSFKPAEFGFVWDGSSWEYINPANKACVQISYYPRGFWEIIAFSARCPKCGNRVWEGVTVFRGRIPSRAFGAQLLASLEFFDLSDDLCTPLFPGSPEGACQG